ncbi:MAG: PRC-barrel domain-containing protein [Opitutaceae bacterium]|nr:PRC-barrel domain-containing protein [Opitutaceae bacterium]
MLRTAKTMDGYALRARDGDIGHVKDLYFDDQYWNLRYFVVDTGGWLTGRRVLVAPESVSGPLFTNDKVIPVDLTREQVKGSPDIDTEQPVERQRELVLREYYGWPAYWGMATPETGVAPVPPLPATDARGLRTSPRDSETAALLDHDPLGDPHLRSTNEVMGYRIAATDGDIGHVEDFLIDVETWRIRYLVVDTRNWWPGKKVVVAPAWIRDVSWDKSSVAIDLTRTAIKNSPPYEPGQTLTPESAGLLHDHYGFPRYPDWVSERRTSGSPKSFRP